LAAAVDVEAAADDAALDAGADEDAALDAGADDEAGALVGSGALLDDAALLDAGAGALVGSGVGEAHATTTSTSATRQIIRTTQFKLRLFTVLPPLHKGCLTNMVYLGFHMSKY
jgi:hypothetical protein